MKKSLVAIAALAATTAFAQSSLTISGTIFAGVNQFKSSVAAKTTSIGNGPAASRLRFVGSEDIGGGTRANFLAEMQPNFGTGTVSGNPGAAAGFASGTGALFNRGAWAGLSGANWGEVRFGRQGTASIGLIAQADQGALLTGFNGGGILFGGSNATSRWISANPGRGQNQGTGLAVSTGNISAVTGLNGIGNNTGSDVTRSINALTYLSPNFGGVTGQVQYAMSNLATGRANGQGNSVGVNLNYANGPVFVGVAYQTAQADPFNNISGKMTTLGATYDFGVAKIGAAFQTETASGDAAGTNAVAPLWTSAKGWALTATAPFGAAVPYIRLGTHQTNGIGQFGNVNGKDSGVVNLGVNYNLSKRTALNFDYAQDSKANSGNLNTGVASSAATSNTNKATLLYVGVQHAF
jgi:predicted porin